MERELLSSRIVKKNGCLTVYEEYYKGHHPNGIDVQGWTGLESKVYRQEIKPVHIFKVKK